MGSEETRAQVRALVVQQRQAKPPPDDYETCGASYNKPVIGIVTCGLMVGHFAHACYDADKDVRFVADNRPVLRNTPRT